MRVINLTKTRDTYDGFSSGYHRILRHDGGIELHKRLKLLEGDKVVFCDEDGTTRTYEQKKSII